MKKEQIIFNEMEERPIKCEGCPYFCASLACDCEGCPYFCGSLACDNCNL